MTKTATKVGQVIREAAATVYLGPNGGLGAVFSIAAYNVMHKIAAAIELENEPTADRLLTVARKMEYAAHTLRQVADKSVSDVDVIMDAIH